MQTFSPIQPPQLEVDTTFLLDVGPFFDRFESAKYAVLCSLSISVQAVIKDAQSRNWIDLKHPAVAQGIDVIIGAGVAGVDAALKDRILNTPASDTENYALRKVYFS